MATNNTSPDPPIPAQETHHSSRGTLTLALCAAGICTSYLYYGMLQEQIFFNKDDTARVDAGFLLMSQTMSNTIVAVVWQRISKLLFSRQEQKSETNKNNGRLHHWLFVMTAFCYFVSMTASNECLHHVSYPTAVLAKSCKLIPTMVMGSLVEGRSYHLREWMGAASITCGIVVFNVSRLQHKENDQGGDSAYGVGLLALSLLFDGLLGACQGLLKHEEKGPNPKYRPPTAIETMFYVNLYAVAFFLPLVVMTGQWSHGIDALKQEGWNGLGHGMAMLNLTAAVGQIFIFLTITLYSPLWCTTITTTRKFFTILLSVLHFGHVFTALQWLCVVLVFGGIYLGIVSKATSEPVKKKQE